jgi:hypothetical protein
MSPFELEYQCCPMSWETPQVCSRSRNTFQEEIRQFTFLPKNRKKPKTLPRAFAHDEVVLSRVDVDDGKFCTRQTFPVHPQPHTSPYLSFVLTLAVKDPCPTTSCAKRRECSKHHTTSPTSWGQSPQTPGLAALDRKSTVLWHQPASTAVAPGGPAERHQPLFRPIVSTKHKTATTMRHELIDVKFGGVYK